MNLSGFKAARDWLSWRSLVIVSPIFLLTVKHWTNLVVMMLCLASLYALHRRRKEARLIPDGDRRWLRAMSLCLAGPFIAVVIGQVLRQDWFPANLDAPLRLVLCIPILLAVSRGWLHPAGAAPIPQIWMAIIFPLTLIGTLLNRRAWTDAWGADRIVTYFVDPLSFSSLTLVLALLSLVALSMVRPSARWLGRLIGAAGILCGLFLSVKGGSRTGWIGIPLFLFLWLRYAVLPLHGRRPALAATVALLTAVIVVFALNPALIQKFQVGLNEVLSYQWQSVNTDGSITIRISMYRMGFHYFLESPLMGWGEHGWLAAANAPEFKTFASEFAIYQQPLAGFHNEILTSSVRSGIWGLMSAIAFFAGPIALSLRTLRRQPGHTERLVALGVLVFSVHLLMASIGTEVNNLVFLASFNGLTLAIGMGWLLSVNRDASTASRPSPVN